jgi:hypothetical protein
MTVIERSYAVTRPAQGGMVGRTYLERGRPVVGSVAGGPARGARAMC